MWFICKSLFVDKGVSIRPEAPVLTIKRCGLYPITSLRSSAAKWWSSMRYQWAITFAGKIIKSDSYSIPVTVIEPNE